MSTQYIREVCVYTVHKSDVWEYLIRQRKISRERPTYVGTTNHVTVKNRFPVTTHLVEELELATFMKTTHSMH